MRVHAQGLRCGAISSRALPALLGTSAGDLTLAQSLSNTTKLNTMDLVRSIRVTCQLVELANDGEKPALRQIQCVSTLRCAMAVHSLVREKNVCVGVYVCACACMCVESAPVCVYVC